MAQQVKNNQLAAIPSQASDNFTDSPNLILITQTLNYDYEIWPKPLFMHVYNIGIFMHLCTSPNTNDLHIHHMDTSVATKMEA